MSQPDFDAAVLDIVQEFGTVGIYNKSVQGSYNPTLGVTPTTSVSISVNVALVDLTKNLNGVSLTYNTEIITGDKEAYLVPPNKTGSILISPIDPVNDSLTVAGVTYSIVTFKEVNPTGSDPILYTLYLRR